MNVKKVLPLICCLVFTAACAGAHAQDAPAFASLNLERLYGSMPANCRAAVAAGGSCTAGGRQVAVRRNSRGEVVHIGYRLFTAAYAGYQPEILAFLERVTFELSLLADQNRLEARLKEYRMSCTYNGAAPGSGFFRQFADGMKAVDTTAVFTLRRDSLTYAAQWDHPAHGTLRVNFPAQYGVITGKDSKELGDMLSDSLLARSGAVRTARMPAAARRQPAGTPERYSGAVYVHRGRSFLIPEINANTYYLKDGRSYSLLYSKTYPLESLANLFVCGEAIQPPMLDITHRKYGNRRQNYSISLSGLTAFLGKDIETYVGFELASRPEIKAVVMFYNRLFNYAHMLLVDTVEDGVFSREGTLKCTLYGYIPTHNISSLFGEQMVKDKPYEEVIWNE